MTAWIIDGVLVDMELAVALEVAKDRVVRAANVHDRSAAEEFNRQLWSLVGRLAEVAPPDAGHEMLETARSLRRTSELHAHVPQVNAKVARRLAGRCPPDGAIRKMMQEWNSHLSQSPNAEFSHWLMNRLERLAPNQKFPV